MPRPGCPGDAHGSTRAELKTSSTSVTPTTASATPTSVRTCGRRLVVAHNHPMTSTGRCTPAAMRRPPTDARRRCSSRAARRRPGSARRRARSRRARASRSQPGRAMVATTASTSAPPASRAVTAAVGDQPASISDFASGPDIPNAKAEPPASSSPSWNWFTGRGWFFSSVF